MSTPDTHTQKTKPTSRIRKLVRFLFVSDFRSDRTPEIEQARAEAHLRKPQL